MWGRSPVRIDLAGGWSDTPPYCLQYGGKVLNLAVDINGHPPVQVFIRVSEEPVIVIRSIDLGVSQTVRTYDELGSYADFGSGFSLAKAALALAGFLPAFHRGNGFASLEEQLRDFGGGLEISLLAAVPKGSGLGTSSILAATLLGTLGEVCGLNWDKMDLFNRTLVLEQMLTTGGGWQDQAGGLFRGIKLVSTGPGIVQQPALRYLPEHLFTGDYANRRVLLYYTGITRLAKNILAEIVRGIFLNSASHLAVLNEFAPQCRDDVQCHSCRGLGWGSAPPSPKAGRSTDRLDPRHEPGTRPGDHRPDLGLRGRLETGGCRRRRLHDHLCQGRHGRASGSQRTGRQPAKSGRPICGFQRLRDGVEHHTELRIGPAPYLQLPRTNGFSEAADG